MVSLAFSVVKYRSTITLLLDLDSIGALVARESSEGLTRFRSSQIFLGVELKCRLIILRFLCLGVGGVCYCAQVGLQRWSPSRHSLASLLLAVSLEASQWRVWSALM